jgi:hypothetical protein
LSKVLGQSLFRLAAVLVGLMFLSSPGFSAMKLPPKDVTGKLVNDLPPPYNVQAVVENRSVALQWRWRPPEEQPLFTDFGFEVLRQDGVNFVTSDTSFVDSSLHESTYTYKVRVRGGSKERGGRLTHVSSWSESVDALVALSCGGTPQIELTVQPTQKVYNSIPSLRMHLIGRVTSPRGCATQNVKYHVDAETGASHEGPLKISPDGHFNDYADALGPDDEIPEGKTTFTVTVSAENEAGPAISNAYAVAVQLRDKFAPQ